MKLKIAIALLFIFPLTILGQGSILESEKMTDEQKRRAQIEEAIRALETDYDKSYQEYERVFYKLRPLEVVLNQTRAKLDKKIIDIEQVLYEMQRQSLKGKCKQINILNSSIGNNSDYCPSLKNQENRLNEQLKEIKSQIAKLEGKKAEENTEKIQQDIEISKLDDEISNLDALLAETKVKKTKKTKSLDDYLKESGRASTVKKSNLNNLDALLARGSNKKETTSNNLDDLLSSSSNNSKTKGKDLDAMLGSAEDDTDFKIDSKNGLEGVIDGRGKILIPYKEWDIIEYKKGLARVRLYFDSYNCPQLKNPPTINAYKEGFVDVKGEFIEGFEIDFIERKGINYRIYLTRSVGYDSNNESYEQYLARERNNERTKEIQERRNELAKKKCRISENNWKNSIISRYR